MNKILVSKIKQVLKTNHFLHKKDVFVRHVNQFTVSIELVKSPWSNQNYSQFWFDFAIYGKLIPVESISSVSDLSLSNTCMLKQNLSYARNVDFQMYQLEGVTRLDDLIEEIEMHIIAAIAFCEKFKTIYELIEFLEQENRRLGYNAYSFMIAITLAQIGDKETSKKFFWESMDNNIAVENWANYFGIDLKKE